METISALEVQETDWVEKTLVCKRAKIAADHATAFFNDSCRLIYQTLQGRAVEADFPPFAIQYARDDRNNMIDLAAAIPIKSILTNMEDLDVITIPATKALFVNHYGSYDHIHIAYNILEKFMLERHYKRTWVLEQYFTDPDIVKDPGQWKTGVYFLLNKPNEFGLH